MSLKIGGGELQSFHLVVLYSSVGKEISQLVHALLMINWVGHITMYSLLNSRIFVCILFFPLQLNPGKQQISYKPFFFFFSLYCKLWSFLFSAWIYGWYTLRLGHKSNKKKLVHNFWCRLQTQLVRGVSIWVALVNHSLFITDCVIKLY